MSDIIRGQTEETWRVREGQDDVREMGAAFLSTLEVGADPEETAPKKVPVPAPQIRMDVDIDADPVEKNQTSGLKRVARNRLRRVGAASESKRGRDRRLAKTKAGQEAIQAAAAGAGRRIPRFRERPDLAPEPTPEAYLEPREKIDPREGEETVEAGRDFVLDPDLGILSLGEATIRIINDELSLDLTQSMMEATPEALTPRAQLQEEVDSLPGMHPTNLRQPTKLSLNWQTRVRGE